jgi:ketosteroid isomerase-like protein
MRNTGGIVLLAGSILLSGCNKPTPATADSATPSGTTAGSFDESAARAQILAADTAYGRDLQSKNLDSLMSYYDADAVSLSAGQKAIKGEGNLRTYYAEQLKTNPRDLTFQSGGVYFSKDHSMAWDYGTYGSTWTSPSGKTMKGTGHFVNVWKNVGGRWVIVAEIANTSP